jgi:hypothetical protein
LDFGLVENQTEKDKIKKSFVVSKMSLFNSKPTVALSDILKGLQEAVSSATSMLQSQQVQNLSHFWQEDGKPVTQKVQVSGKDIDVPLMALVPHSNLAMDTVQIKFKARVGEVSSQNISNVLNGDNIVSHADIQLNMNDILLFQDI